MFTSPTGGLLDPDILTKVWAKVCRDVGVKYNRHHHATALIGSSVHIKTAQTRLGHSSPALTMSVYAHVSPGLDREAAEAYERAMSG